MPNQLKAKSPFKSNQVISKKYQIATEVNIKSKKWLLIPNIEKFVIQQINKIIPHLSLKNFIDKNIFFEVAVMLTNNLQIKKLNHQFLDKNNPTNVLSFANLDEKIIQKSGLQKAIGKNKYVFLGDIILAYEYIQNEAIKQNKDFHDHLTHLILHALLHLMGHDHQRDDMAQKMEALEITILNKLEIKNPYLLN